MIIQGGQPNDVILSAPHDQIGDSLAIHLSQLNPLSAAVWLLQVWVQTVQGEFVAGRITTNTIAADNNQPSRTVAFATIPGAIGWKVFATCTTTGERAELTLSSSKNSSSNFGVVRNTTL